MGGKHKRLVHVTRFTLTPFPVQPTPPPECLCGTPFQYNPFPVQPTPRPNVCGTNQFGVIEVLECPEEHLERESEPEDEGREDEHEFTGAHQHCVEHDQVDSHV